MKKMGGVNRGCCMKKRSSVVKGDKLRKEIVLRRFDE